MEKLKLLLASRKFWAALIGLVLMLVKTWQPDFPLEADSLAGMLGILTLGLLACYIPGTLWLMMLTGRTAAEALPLAVYPFLPGDAVKIITAAMLAPKLRKALKRVA